MDCKKITPEVSVAGQLRPQDVPQAHAMGFRSLICNRPDGEEANQPLFEDIERAAEISGMKAYDIPVSGGGVTEAHIKALAEIWDDLPKPVLLYCRSGARSATLVNAVLKAKRAG